MGAPPSTTVLIIDLPHKVISGSLTLSSVTAVVAWACEPLASAAARAQGAAAAAAAGGAKAGGASGRGGAAALGGAAAPPKPVLVVVTGGNKLYTFREVRVSVSFSFVGGGLFGQVRCGAHVPAPRALAALHAGPSAAQRCLLQQCLWPKEPRRLRRLAAQRQATRSRCARSDGER